MKTTLRIAAMAAALLIPIIQSEARRHIATQQFGGSMMTNEGRYEPAQITTERPRTTSRRVSRHREAHPARPRLDAHGAPVAAAAIDQEAIAWVSHPAQRAARGFIKSAKTGATASISKKYEARFQALLDDLEAWSPETKVYYMGGYRPGHCSPAHQHSCNQAVDYCQDSRGVVSGARDCHLPPPEEFHRLVAKHHLHDGSVWCNGDFGHVQAVDSGGCKLAAHGMNGGVLYTITGNAVVASARSHSRRAVKRYVHRHRYRVAGR